MCFPYGGNQVLTHSRCHLSQTSTATSTDTDPPPANSPTMQRRQISKDRNFVFGEPAYLPKDQYVTNSKKNGLIVFNFSDMLVVQKFPVYAVVNFNKYLKVKAICNNFIYTEIYSL